MQTTKQKSPQTPFISTGVPRVRVPVRLLPFHPQEDGTIVFSFVGKLETLQAAFLIGMSREGMVEVEFSSPSEENVKDYKDILYDNQKGEK